MLSLFFGQYGANAAPMSIMSLIETLRASPPKTRGDIEGRLGVTLRLHEENEAYRFYVSSDQPRHNQAISKVSFSEPIPGVETSGGTMIGIDIAGPCVRQREVEAKIGKLELFAVPSPHDKSGTGQLSLIHYEPWGRLSFGFAVKEPRCLINVGFKMGASVAE